MNLFQHFLIDLLIMPNLYMISTYSFLALIFIWLTKAAFDLITDKSDD